MEGVCKRKSFLDLASDKLMPVILVVIRDRWNEISQKASFVTQIFRANPNVKIFSVFRRDKEKFKEKWSLSSVELPTTPLGIFFYYLLMMLKSPKELYEGLMRRFFRRKLKYTLVSEGFISEISLSLSQFFASAGRSEKIISFFKNRKLRQFF